MIPRLPRRQPGFHRQTELTLARASAERDNLARLQPRVQVELAPANITVATPADPVDDVLLVLEVRNTSAGVITVTLPAGFRGTFTAPAAGMRRTQLYRYDEDDAQWVPVGAQSGDL